MLVREQTIQGDWIVSDANASGVIDCVGNRCGDATDA